MKKYKLRHRTSKEMNQNEPWAYKTEPPLVCVPSIEKPILFSCFTILSANRRNNHQTTDAINPRLFFLPRLQTLTQTSVKEGKATVEGFKLKRILTLHNTLLFQPRGPLTTALAQSFRGSLSAIFQSFLRAFLSSEHQWTESEWWDE